MFPFFMAASILQSPRASIPRIDVHSPVPTFEDPVFEVAVTGALTFLYSPPVTGATTMAHPMNEPAKNMTSNKQPIVFFTVFFLLSFFSLWVPSQTKVFTNHSRGACTVITNFLLFLLSPSPIKCILFFVSFSQKVWLLRPDWMALLGSIITLSNMVWEINKLKTAFCEKKDCILHQQVTGLRTLSGLLIRLWNWV